MEVKSLERILKALANRRRLAVVRYLASRSDASVTQIAQAIHLSLTATSKHLAVLKAADIVTDEKRSLLVFYSIARPLHPTTKLIVSLFAS